VRVASIVGARPQFVKAAMVTRAMRCVPHVREVLIHTGQHYDPNMTRVFFDELALRPDYDLHIGSGTHGAQTGRMLEAIERVLLDESPDWVLVYGDTNTTLAGALAAVKLGMPVAHIEAGLRLYDRHMPEEVNRLVADHVADINFAPTETAQRNLRSEGIPPSRIRLVGDVMYDAALYYGTTARQRVHILQRLAVDPGSYVLATVHRAGNTDSPAALRAIFEGLRRIAATRPVVLPLHPRTRQALVRERIMGEVAATLRVLAPVGYLDMLLLEQFAGVIATDSGGVQKEAFFHGVPCVTLATSTPWKELVDLGWNRVLPAITADDVERGVQAAVEAPPGVSASPYGDGNSAARIASELAGGTLEDALPPQLDRAGQCSCS